MRLELHWPFGLSRNPDNGQSYSFRADFSNSNFIIWCLLLSQISMIFADWFFACCTSLLLHVPESDRWKNEVYFGSLVQAFKSIDIKLIEMLTNEFCLYVMEPVILFCLCELKHIVFTNAFTYKITFNFQINLKTISLIRCDIMQVDF